MRIWLWLGMACEKSSWTPREHYHQSMLSIHCVGCFHKKDDIKDNENSVLRIIFFLLTAYEPAYHKKGTIDFLLQFLHWQYL